VRSFYIRTGSLPGEVTDHEKPHLFTDDGTRALNVFIQLDDALFQSIRTLPNLQELVHRPHEILSFREQRRPERQPREFIHRIDSRSHLIVPPANSLDLPLLLLHEPLQLLQEIILLSAGVDVLDDGSELVF
jgi:hypothetical protein